MDMEPPQSVRCIAQALLRLLESRDEGSHNVRLREAQREGKLHVFHSKKRIALVRQ